MSKSKIVEIDTDFGDIKSTRNLTLSKSGRMRARQFVNKKVPVTDTNLYEPPSSVKKNGSSAQVAVNKSDNVPQEHGASKKNCEESYEGPVTSL